MLKVFVSSTSEDLAPFRKAAEAEILAQHWHPDMMEYAGTDPDASVLDSCAKRVEASDLVLAIVGWKRGSLPPGRDGWQSYTAWEIESAKQLKKPLMVLMAAKKGWPKELEEEDPETRSSVASFRRKLDRRAVFFDWEEARADLREPLPIFQSKLRLELLARRERILSRDVRSSWRALRTAWVKREKALRASIEERDLEKKQDLPLREIDQLGRSWLAEKRPWHLEVQDCVDELGEKTPPGPRSAQMILSLQSLDFDDNYLALCQRIRDLLRPEVEEEIQAAVRESQAHLGKGREPGDDTWSRKHHNDSRVLALFSQLEEMVTHPTFRRCLLLSGSIGSGKTHRAAHFETDPFRPAGVSRNQEEAPAAPSPQGPFDAPWRWLVLWLEQGSAVRRLETEILDGLRQMTGREWESLEDFDRSLRNAAGQMASRVGAPRLMIVLQDLHRWIRARPGFLEELTRMLDRTTQLHSFYWMLTIQDTAYDRITGETLEELWRSMSLTPALKPRMLSGRQPSRQEPDLTDREGLLGSWIDLDEINRREDLGFRLIAREIPESPVDPLAFDERPRQLSNPQLAWILLDCREELPPDRAINLHFIGFIERFWRLRWQRLATQATEKKMLSEAKMEQVLALLARAVLEQADLYPEKGWLIDRAVAQGKELLRRSLRKQITAGLDLLEAAGLLTPETVKGGRARREERVALKSLFFWYFQLAQELFSSMDQLSGAELDAWLASLPRQCAGFSEEDREGTLELLLLHADDQRRDDAARLDRTLALWRRVLETPELPQAAVWLAAAKGSVWAQQLAAGFAREGCVRRGERRALFGFLYFLSEVGCLSSPERAALLQPLFGVIHEASLQSYCLYVLRRILDAAADREEWLAAVSALTGCEILDKTEAIGRMAVRRAAELVKEETGELLRLFVRYLRTEQPEVRGDIVLKPWKRHFLREWILLAGFDLLSKWKQQEGSGPAGLFDELAEFGWYEPETLKVTGRIGREMEQEANTALGLWYREWAWPADREELAAVIQELVNSHSPRNRQLAFFLMRHTGRPDPNGAMMIPPEFRGDLKRIARDPLLAWLRETEPFRTELLRKDNRKDQQ